MDLANFLRRRLQAASALPLYRQLAAALEAAIHAGHLHAGDRLPPERRLAAELCLSRTTIVNAYRLLEQDELVFSHIGSGTYVGQKAPAPAAPMPWNQLLLPHLDSPLSSILRSLLAVPAAPDSISLAAGMPDPRLYPLAAMGACLARATDELPPGDLGHLPTEGYEPLRRALAAWLQNRQLTLQPEDLLVLSGSQQGLYLLGKCFLAPGDSVIVESPTYLGAIQVFQAAGARLLALPGTLDVASLPVLEDYLVRYRPKLFYLGATFQNPTGRVLDLSLRQALLELAARHRLVIVEDDAYGQLGYDGAPPPLKALDTYGGVLYLGSASKVFCPGLRLGWLTGPREVLNRLAEEKQYVDLHSANLSQWLLAQYLAAGEGDRHLALVRQVYRCRRDALAQALRRHCGGELSFELPEGGFYLWCRLRQGGSAQALLYEAAQGGVSFVPGEAFYAGRAGADELRLCFATHDEAALETAAQRLGQALRRMRRHGPRQTMPAFRLGQPIL